MPKTKRKPSEEIQELVDGYLPHANDLEELSRIVDTIIYWLDKQYEKDQT